MSPNISRRKALQYGFILSSSGLLSSLSGCLSDAPDDASTKESSTTTDQTQQKSATPETTAEKTTSSHYRSVEVSLTEVSAESVAEGVLRSPQSMRAFERDLVQQAISAGTVTFAHTVFEPLSDRFYVTHSGKYYELTRSVINEQSVTGQRFSFDAISTCDGTTQDITEDPISFETLPDADKQTFELGHVRHLDEKLCFGGGTKVYYPPADKDSSLFINESPTFVRYDDETYVVRYEGAMQLTLTTFRFTANVLGNTNSEYTAAVVPNIVWQITPTELPTSERKFFFDLLDDGYYYTENPVPAHVDSFIQRISKNAPLEINRGSFYLEYEGTYYRLRSEEVVS